MAERSAQRAAPLPVEAVLEAQENLVDAADASPQESGQLDPFPPVLKNYLNAHAGVRLDIRGRFHEGPMINLGLWFHRAPGRIRLKTKRRVHFRAILFTDDWMAYKPLRPDYAGHGVINHPLGVYVEGDLHTNTIEGFFGNLNTGMRGTYNEVSKKWLQSYLDKYAWRYNQRHRGQRSMFHLLVGEAAAQ